MFPSHRRSRWSSRRHFEPVRLSHTHSSSEAHCAGAASLPLLRLASQPLTPLQASLRFLPLSRAHVNAHASLPSNADTSLARARANASASNRPRPETPTQLPAPTSRQPAGPPAGPPPPLSAGLPSMLRPGPFAPARRPQILLRARPPASPPHAVALTHTSSLIPPLVGQLRRRPSPTSPGRVVTPDPPHPPQSTTHTQIPSGGEKCPVSSQPPSTPVGSSQSHNLRTGGLGQESRCSPQNEVSRGQAAGPR